MKKKQRKKWMQIYKPWHLVLFWVTWGILMVGGIVAMATIVRHSLVGLPVMLLLTGLMLFLVFAEDEDKKPMAALCIGLPMQKIKQALQRIAALFIEKGNRRDR